MPAYLIFSRQGTRSTGSEGGGLAVEDLFDDAVDLEDGPRGRDGLRLGLAGVVDDHGGSLIEEAARGCIVFRGPCRQPVPGVDAPGVVALDDEAGLVPTGRCLQGGENLAENVVGEGQVVEVGTVATLGVVILNATPDVGAVRNGKVQEDEVGLIGVQELEGVVMEVSLGLVAVADVEATEVAVGAGG